jgi:hypothetical protein
LAWVLIVGTVWLLGLLIPGLELVLSDPVLAPLPVVVELPCRPSRSKCRSNLPRNHLIGMGEQCRRDIEAER